MYEEYIKALLQSTKKSDQPHRTESEFERRKRLIREGKL
jgi:hypothetical protein